jgi:hypothetical protein
VPVAEVKARFVVPIRPIVLFDCVNCNVNELPFTEPDIKAVVLQGAAFELRFACPVI